MEDDYDFEDYEPSQNVDGLPKSSACYEASNWPFPDPNEGLDKYFSPDSIDYLGKFEQWWDKIQQNKNAIEQSEYTRLIRLSEIKYGKKLHK